MIDINCSAPKIQRIASMGTVLFRRNTDVFQGKNRSQRRETVRFGLMGFDSLLLYTAGEGGLYFADSFPIIYVGGETDEYNRRNYK